MIRCPPHARGMRIGLFGGSFNPAHQGHILVTLAALKRLKLDCIWWLVTPGNPLKQNNQLPSIEARIAGAQKLMQHPRVIITGLEEELGTRYTYATLKALKAACPFVKFTWIMGADQLLQFQRWQHWQKIPSLCPIAIVDRPGSTVKMNGAHFVQRFANKRIAEAAASRLKTRHAPAWVFLHGPRSSLSSTQLRAQQGGHKQGAIW